MKTLLTAIVFTYNHKNSIANCLNSILEQKTIYPYEVHVWDDASIDGTSDICRDFAKRYPDKIKLVVQEKNTFCGPYEKMQSLAAIKAIKTPYFCIIDGDDCWCDKNKIQIALDFLESNPQYFGFAHDTLLVDEMRNVSQSYIHDALDIKHIENPVSFCANAPFFLTSSRIFRTSNYASLNILPIDYLFYYYNLAQGPIYYYDKIMAKYIVSGVSTFASQGKSIKDLNSMFPYKLSLLFDFKQDEFCTEMQKKYDVLHQIGEKRYNRLIFLKKVFGVKLGWKIFFWITFVRNFGFDCTNINYIYSDRRMVKKKSDEYEGDLSRKKKLLEEKLTEIDALHKEKGSSQDKKLYSFYVDAILLARDISDQRALIKLNEYSDCKDFILSDFCSYHLKSIPKLKKVKKLYQYFVIAFLISVFVNLFLGVLLWRSL